MKKRILRIALILLCILLSAAVVRAAWIYIGNYTPNKDHFGKTYIQVIYPTSIPDYLVAQEVLQQADAALSTITDEQRAESIFGELGFLCITDAEAVSESHDLKFIAANFSGNKGYMWVNYSSKAYDENGDVTFGSLDILSRWELEKINGRWTVTSKDEHP